MALLATSDYGHIGCQLKEASHACVQAFQPDVLVVNAAWPAGAYVADRLNIPKVALSMLAPCIPGLNAVSQTGAWPALTPVVPKWQPQPMVSKLVASLHPWPTIHLCTCSCHPLKGLKMVQTSM